MSFARVAVAVAGIPFWLMIVAMSLLAVGFIMASSIVSVVGNALFDRLIPKNFILKHRRTKIMKDHGNK